MAHRQGFPTLELPRSMNSLTPAPNLRQLQGSEQATGSRSTSVRRFELEYGRSDVHRNWPEQRRSFWDPAVPGGPASWRDAYVLMLLALVLNFQTLESRSIVLDEAASILYARRTISSLLLMLTGDDPNMGLYYVLLHFWVRIAGDSEAAVRSLSAVFAALAVPTLYFLGEGLFGRTAGLLSGLMLALNAFLIKYAQLARSYALRVFLATLSSYFFIVELEQPSKRARVGYLLASSLAIYAHYFAPYVLLAHAVTLVTVRRRAAFTRKWLGLATMIFLL